MILVSDLWGQPSNQAATPVLGDLTGDGFVEFADVDVVEDHWGQTGPLGDANSDNIVNIFDVNMISDNWSPGTAAPEPATLSLILLAGVTLTVVRLAGRRRRAR